MKETRQKFKNIDDYISSFPVETQKLLEQVRTGISAFGEDLSAYENAKGSVKFPNDKPVPFDIIRKIVLFRVGENIKKPNRKL